MAVDSLEPLSSAIPVAQDVLIWKEFIQRERKRNCRAFPGSSRKFGWSGCEQIVTVVPTVFGVVVEVLVVVLVIMGVKESGLIVVVDVVV